MICYVLGNKANNEIWIIIIFSTPSLIIVTRFGWYDNDVGPFFNFLFFYDVTLGIYSLCMMRETYIP